MKNIPSELNPITGRKHQLRKQLLILVTQLWVILLQHYQRKSSKQINVTFKLKFKINDIKYNFKAPYDKFFEEFIKKNI